MLAGPRPPAGDLPLTRERGGRGRCHTPRFGVVRWGALLGGPGCQATLR